MPDEVFALLKKAEKGDLPESRKARIFASNLLRRTFSKASAKPCTG